jgi:hypothetical protein
LDLFGLTIFFNCLATKECCISARGVLIVAVSPLMILFGGSWSPQQGFKISLADLFASGGKLT